MKGFVYLFLRLAKIFFRNVVIILCLRNLRTWTPSSIIVRSENWYTTSMVLDASW